MVRITIFSLLAIILNLNSQPLLEWEKWYKGPWQEDEIRAIAVDEFGNSYVIGGSDGNPDRDIFTSDWVTISYDPHGRQRWLVRSESPYNDWPFDLRLSKQNNVYITGFFNRGWRTAKYTSMGESVWVRTFPEGYARALIIDRYENKNIYVSGVIGLGDTQDIQVIKYDSAGTELWRTVCSREPREDITSIALDSIGNIFVTGLTAMSCITVKFSSSGNIEWVRTYPNGIGKAIETDLEGNVVVAACCDSDYVAIKYDTDGNEIWIRRYGDPWVGDEPNDLLIDEEGNIYMTGTSKSRGGNTGSDFLTIKYKPDGDTMWVSWFDCELSEEVAYTITMDNLGYIYISGSSHDYRTAEVRAIGVKYNRHGAEKWAVVYKGGVASYAFNVDVSADALGNAYIGGGLPEPRNNDVDFITLKYRVSDSPFATFPNQGRHLARAPNTSDLDWSYEGHDSRVIYQTMGEMLMLPPVYIGQGKYPSIAKKEILPPWVTITTGEQLYCLIKKPDGTWKKKEVANADAIGAPSSVLSVTQDDVIWGDLGYVVYQVTSYQTGRTYIYFSAFDSANVYYTGELDRGDIPNGGPVVTPSIAITPGDYIHVVWCKEGKVYYKTTLQPITPSQIRRGQQPVWSEKVPISTPTQPITEPASNPFIEAYGDSVFAVWRGPNEYGEDIGEIWQRKRRLDRPIDVWSIPIIKSRNSILQESNYPTMSTKSAVAWQERLPQNWEIYANINDQIFNLSQTSNNSNYPHTNFLPPPPYPPSQWRLFTIWTEESIPNRYYKIKLKDYYFPIGDYPVALDIAVGGEEPSPYCLQRDGYLSFSTFPVDYGQELIYKLPYLHPQKHYLLSIIGYQKSSGTFESEIILGNSVLDTLTYSPFLPETLIVGIPYGSYDSTWTILKFRKISGDYCSVAGIKLYEYEVFEEEGGGSQSLANNRILKTLLYSPFPNPFTKGLKIKYQLAKESRVSLKVYNLSGRLIKTLTDDRKKAGIYTMNFTGVDESGKRLPFGVYFVRFKADDFSDTKKVVLMR